MDAPSPATHPLPPVLAQLPFLVVTRFSFLGRSGWKSDASRDAALLFAPQRLALRLALLTQVTLPSLVAQSEPDFHHLILTSRDLPGAAATALAEACAAAYGDPGRFTILARPVENGRKSLRRFLKDRYGDRPVAQVVLDDDDGLASDFLATLRADLARLQAEEPELGTRLPHVLSYPRGYALLLRKGAPPGLYLHSYPWINLGLTLLGGAPDKNLFGISHRTAHRRFGGHLLQAEGKPMFLRAVHDFNDSRVALERGWRAVADWRADPEVQARFPWLLARDTLWA